MRRYKSAQSFLCAVLSLSTRTTAALGRKARRVSSTRCVPCPTAVRSWLPQSGHLNGMGSRWSQWWQRSWRARWCNTILAEQFGQPKVWPQSPQNNAGAKPRRLRYTSDMPPASKFCFKSCKACGEKPLSSFRRPTLRMSTCGSCAAAWARSVSCSRRYAPLCALCQLSKLGVALPNTTGQPLCFARHTAKSRAW